MEEYSVEDILKEAYTTNGSVPHISTLLDNAMDILLLNSISRINLYRQGRYVRDVSIAEFRDPLIFELFLMEERFEYRGWDNRIMNSSIEPIFNDLIDVEIEFDGTNIIWRSRETGNALYKE